MTERRKTVSRQRRRELMREALGYCGDLVRNVVDTYSAFGDLPPEEQEFIDEYIESVGQRLVAQSERMRP